LRITPRSLNAVHEMYLAIQLPCLERGQSTR
jgi:hypothetical protein